MRQLLTLLLLVPALFAGGEYSNRRAPGFSLSDSKGVQHDPQDYRGKPILLEFMQTTCPHCARFTDILEQAKAKYKGKIEVMYLVTAPDTLPMVQKYIVDHKVTGPILFDSGQVMASYLKITPQNPSVTFPHVFLIDGNGMIKNDFGYGTSTTEIFEGTGINAEIDKLLGK